MKTEIIASGPVFYPIIFFDKDCDCKKDTATNKKEEYIYKPQYENTENAAQEVLLGIGILVYLLLLLFSVRLYFKFRSE